MPLVEVRDLVKLYDDVRAVDGASFSVEEGEVFGFLGPNGAGKTTTIKVLVTLTSATSGDAVVDGLDVKVSPHEIRTRIGYAAQFIGIDDDLTARENLALQGRLHGLARTRAHKNADQLLEIMSLTEVANRRAATFSGGMRRRLDLAQALVHEPKLVFLDEPTTGLDPQNRRALWSYLRELNEKGITIFLTTQYLEEADELAHRLAIIDHGKIVVEGTPGELKASLGGDVVTVSLPTHADDGMTNEVKGQLEALEGARDVHAFDSSVAVYLQDGASRLAEIVRNLDAHGLPVDRIELAQPSLDEVFLRLTGTRLRVEEQKAPGRVMMRGRRRRG